MKLSDFVAGLIMTSLVLSLFTLYIAGLNDKYHRDDYDSSTLEAYNKLDNLTKQAENIRTEVTGIKQDRDVLDILGGFFVSSYSTIVLTASSVDTFDEMANSAAKDSSLGKVGLYIKTALVAVVIVLIFIAVIVSAIAKWPI